MGQAWEYTSCVQLCLVPTFEATVMGGGEAGAVTENT